MQHPTANTEPTLSEVQARFAAWRQIRQRGRRLPEELWSAAVELTKVHSLNAISRALKLNYTDLQRRCADYTPPRTGHSRPSPDFIAIDLPCPDNPAECVLEMVHQNGNKMRMHFKGKVSLDLQSLAESFWREGTCCR